MPEGTVPDISAPLHSTAEILIGFGTDFFAFIVVAAAIAALAFYFGGDRLIALIAGIYAAIPVYTLFPYRDLLPDHPYVSIGLFAAFVFAGLMCFSGLADFLASDAGGFFRLLILSTLTAGLLLAVSIHLLPVEEVYTFSAPTKALFASDLAYFWWLIFPAGGLFFFGRG